VGPKRQEDRRVRGERTGQAVVSEQDTEGQGRALWNLLGEREFTILMKVTFNP
jgi:hypothetical protein